MACATIRVPTLYKLTSSISLAGYIGGSDGAQNPFIVRSRQRGSLPAIPAVPEAPAVPDGRSGVASRRQSRCAQQLQSRRAHTPHGIQQLPIRRPTHAWPTCGCARVSPMFASASATHPTQYERPHRTQHVAGLPEMKHGVPSGRGGCSKGMQSVLAATEVAHLSSSSCGHPTGGMRKVSGQQGGARGREQQGGERAGRGASRGAAVGRAPWAWRAPLRRPRGLPPWTWP